jgi:hypothetical protein
VQQSTTKLFIIYMSPEISQKNTGLYAFATATSSTMISASAEKNPQDGNSQLPARTLEEIIIDNRDNGKTTYADPHIVRTSNRPRK